jgi:PEP-CTERM motif
MNKLVSRILSSCAALAVIASSVPSMAALLSPVATSGHDQDVIVELGATVGSQVSFGEFGSRQFYEDGLQASQPTNPMPGLTQSVTGFISGITGNAIDYDFEPFSANNILKFDTAEAATKTLTLDAPAGYAQLAVVLSGGSLASSEFANVSYTIHYDGGGTQAGIVDVGDWGNVPAPAGTEVLVNVGRINISSGGGAGTWNDQVPESNTTANRWSIYVSEITPSSTANILSVDFGPVTLNGGPAGLNSGDDVAVFGLSGALVPEPSAVALAATAALGFGRRRRMWLS